METRLWDTVNTCSQATLWQDVDSLTSAHDRAAMSGKWKNLLSSMVKPCLAHNHYTMISGGCLEAQNNCQVVGGIHMRKNKRRVLHISLSRIAAFTLTVAKQYISCRDRSGWLYFAVGMNGSHESWQLQKS